MILDKIENADKYSAISKNLKTAIEFMKSADFAAMSNGKHVVDGDEVFVNVSEYSTRERNLFEAHKDYADIQLLISGEEFIDYAPISDCKIEDLYNAENDYYTLSADKYLPITLKSGFFAVFFPDEPHRPCIKINSSAAVKKVVIKVKM